MKIVVIGIGGVGMAHICAAGRLGLSVVGLIDTNPLTLDKSKQRWVNEWNGFVEETEVQSDTLYSQDIRDLVKMGLSEDDLIILATPPHTHRALIRICLDFSKAKILVEKPISNENYFNQSDRLIVSAEWVFHNKVRKIKDIQDIGMAYPSSQTTDWGYKMHPSLDFCPHLYSIILSKGYELIYTSKEMLTSTSFKFNVVALLGDEKSKIKMWGDRNGSVEGLSINDQKIDWQDNLFDLQLDHIRQTGRGGVEWQEMLSLENQIKKFLL